MRGKLVFCCSIGLALGTPVLASASPAVAGTNATSSVAPRPLARGTVAGNIIFLDGSSFTVRTAGRTTGVVNALTATANKITRSNFPYVYGGGHSHAGTPSTGIKGPGYNGHRVGYDCSGSVAAVLAGGGLWRAGSGVPADNGIISELRARHLIGKGAGKGPVAVTLYDDPGVHIFMNIDGRFFGTSAGANSGDPAGGAGWLGTYAPDATTPYYKRWHFLPRVLRGSTKAGHDVTFELKGGPSFAAFLAQGASVRVSYTESQAGVMVATGIAPSQTSTATGTVTSVAPDLSSFTIQTSAGTSLTVAAGEASAVVATLTAGDPVSVSYAETQSGAVALAVTVTGPPPAP